MSAQNTVFVYPRKGYKIPDPAQGDFLPATGRTVSVDLYWSRLLRDGDVSTEAPAAAAPAPAPIPADPTTAALEQAAQAVHNAEVLVKAGKSGAK